MASVNTVLGPLDVEYLGPTMSHVHLTINLLCWHQPPEAGPLYGLSKRKLTMDMLGIVRRWPFSIKDNLVHDDLASAELREYVLAGGRTVVAGEHSPLADAPWGQRSADLHHARRQPASSPSALARSAIAGWGGRAMGRVASLHCSNLRNMALDSHKAP